MGVWSTEELHHGEWHDLQIPPPGGYCNDQRADRPDVRCTERYGHPGWAHRATVDGCRHTWHTPPPRGLTATQLDSDVRQLRGLAYEQTAELTRLRAELEKYVGKEPTRDEEAQYVNRCLDAVYDACEAARRDGRVLTVEEIEQAADGNRPGARKILTETLAELAARARRVAESHQRFIEDHQDPGTEALCAQYELAQTLVRSEGAGQPKPVAEPDIPWATARHVLWMFGEDGGMRPGSFTEQLINTCARADVTHLARLGQAYPAEAHAVHLAKNTEDGITRLQTIAGGVA
ncbi:hypothetical protein [Streptomyces decoyicus]